MIVGALFLALATSASAAILPGRHSTAGFYNSAYGTSFAMVAQSSGYVQYVEYYPGGTTLASGVVASYPSVLQHIAGYYSNDGFMHLIVGNSNGQIREVYWNSTSQYEHLLGQVSAGSITAVTGWSDIFDYWHVAVGSGGQIYEMAYGPHVSNPSWNVIGGPGGSTILDIAGYATSYSGESHIIVNAGIASVIYDMNYGQYGLAYQGVGYVKTNGQCAYDGLNSLTGYWAPHNGYVAMAFAKGGNLCVQEYSYPGNGIFTTTPANIAETFGAPITSVGGFGGPVNGSTWKENIVAFTTGGADDVYWNTSYFNYKFLGAF